MTRGPSRAPRHAAFLLPTLPALVAVAAYAHGHGSLGGAALAAVVTLAIVAGGAVAALLLGATGPARAGAESLAYARQFTGYRP